MESNLIQSRANVLASDVTPLRGWIVKTYVNYKGKRLGPYYSRTWKERGKIKREYVRHEDLARVRAACAAYKEKRQRRSACTKNLNCIIGNLNYLHRMCKRQLTQPLRPEDYAFVHQIEQNGYSIPGHPSLRSPSPNRHSAIKNRAIGAGASASQYLTPNTQHPKDFMYPSNAISPEDLKSQLLAPTTQTAPRTQPAPSELVKELKRIRTTFTREQLKSESIDEKWNRWLKAWRELPTPRPNVRRALPDGITREQLEKSVDRLTQLTSTPTPRKPAAPAVPQTPTPHPRIPPRNFPWEVELDANGRVIRPAREDPTTDDEHDTSTDTTNTVQLDQSDDLPPASPSVYGLPFTVYAPSNERSFAQELKRMREQA